MYLWLGNYLKIISSNQSEIISPNSLGSKLFIIAKEVIKDFVQLFKKNKKLHKKTAFVETTNNIKSLSFLKSHVHFVSPKKIKNKKLEVPINLLTPRLKFFYDLVFIFFFIRLLINSDSKQRSKYFSRFEMLFMSYGIVDEYIRILSINKPEKLIFTNDHNIYARGLLIAAKKVGIKTYYIQHASVSKYFPPLEFDVSLLEGYDAKNKYLSIKKTSSQITLVGMPKFDYYAYDYNTNKKVKAIGLCYNLNDSITDIVYLANKILLDFTDIKLILRSHPNDNRMNNSTEYLFSNSKNEDSFVFLQEVDLIISGDSSIHVEAIMMNVVSLYYNFSKNIKMNDYYGFVKNKLIVECTNYKELKNNLFKEINQKSDVQYKSKFYNEAIDSDFYGKSSQKVIKIIA